jgi:hypothetical protein
MTMQMDGGFHGTCIESTAAGNDISTPSSDRFKQHLVCQKISGPIHYNMVGCAQGL